MKFGSVGAVIAAASSVSPYIGAQCVIGATVGTGKRNVTYEFELRSVFY